MSADSGTVKIRVGLIDDGGIIGAGIAAPDGPTGFKKIGKEKPKVAMKKNRSVEEKAAFIKDVKSKVNNTALSISEKQKMVEKLNTLASPNAESSACFIGDFIESTFGIGSVDIVQENECDNISTEHSTISYNVVERNEFYPISVNDNGDYLQISELAQVCDDPNKSDQAGGSKPIEYKRFKYDYNTNTFIKSWELEPYKIVDKVHYYFVNPQNNNPTPLILDFIAGVCYLKINPPGSVPKMLIENINEVNDPAKILQDDAEQAFADFCGFNCYPNELYKYVPIELIRIHEREHLADYKSIIEEMFPTLINDIENYKDLCESYDETHRLNAEKVIYDLIWRFVQRANKEIENLSGSGDSAKELDHEREIQSRPSIKGRIEDYKTALEKRFPLKLFGKDCSNCSYQ